MPGSQKALILFFAMVFALPAMIYAQRLPGKQENGLRIPAGMVVDGKASEWQDIFQAFNKAIQVFYTMANDDKNLYLVVRAADPLVVQKILYGSVVFTVTPKTNNRSKELSSLQFPVLSKKDKDQVFRNFSRKSSTMPGDSIAARRFSDSLLTAANQQLLANARLKVNGLGIFPDSLVSANGSAVHWAAKFSPARSLTYEITVPLAELKIIPGKGAEFNYNIKLNSTVAGNTIIQLSGDGKYITRATPGFPTVSMPISPASLVLEFPTDFSATYIMK